MNLMKTGRRGMKETIQQVVLPGFTRIIYTKSTRYRQEMIIVTYFIVFTNALFLRLPTLFRTSEKEESFLTLSRSASTTLVTLSLSTLIFNTDLLPLNFLCYFPDREQYTLIYKKRILQLFFAYVRNEGFSTKYSIKIVI